MTQLPLLDASPNEVERAFAEGLLTVEVDARVTGRCPWTGLDQRCVHVISKARFGEIRGYALLEDGRLIIRTPTYTGAWHEVDRLVERVVGGQVEPYPVNADGSVRAPLMKFVEVAA